jgi:hypothetical protein
MDNYLAVAALGAAALYYLLPLVRGVFGGSSSASPPPGELPPFLPRSAPPAIEPLPLRPTVEQRMQAIATLQKHYTALGMDAKQLDELLTPHFQLVLVEPKP